MIRHYCNLYLDTSTTMTIITATISTSISGITVPATIIITEPLLALGTIVVLGLPEKRINKEINEKKISLY